MSEDEKIKRMKDYAADMPPRKSDEDDDNNIINAAPIFDEKYMPKSGRDKQSEPAAKYDSSENSKEKYLRLNPYLENIITQLRTNFDDFELPVEIYHRLAEAQSITGRADIWSSQLLLTITKLRPLLQKKLGISKDELKRIVSQIIKKVLTEQLDHYTLDNIPDGLWFFGDKPKSNAMDILLAARRINCVITYDEWADVCRVTYGNEVFDSMKIDDIYFLLLKEFTYKFKLKIEKKHVMDAIGVMRRDSENVFNSRIDELNGFVAHYDPEFDWRREIVEILSCAIDKYSLEVARMLFISPIERSYRPGCLLQHMVVLDDPKGDKGKSTLCRILAGNPTLKFEERRYFTDKNVFAIKNDVTRYAETKGIAVHEYAELAGLSKFDLEHLKNDISSTVESCRPLFSMDLLAKPRWFYTIGTTNRDEYNYDIVNRRYYGLKVGIDGKMIDNVRLIENYKKIMGALVWNVKNGMSGAADRSIAPEAKYQQDIRIVETDLAQILKPVFAFAHIDKDLVPSDINLERLRERYQVGYKDHRDGDGKIVSRMYMISLKGLTNFVTDWIDYTKRKDIRIDAQTLKKTILQVNVIIDAYVSREDDKTVWLFDDAPKDRAGNVDSTRAVPRPICFKWEKQDAVTRLPQLYNPIRGYSLTIEARDIGKVDSLAHVNLLEYQYFIEDYLKYTLRRPPSKP